MAPDLVERRTYWTYYIDRKISRITSPTRVLGTWKQFTVSLKMRLFIYLL